MKNKFTTWLKYIGYGLGGVLILLVIIGMNVDAPQEEALVVPVNEVTGKSEVSPLAPNSVQSPVAVEQLGTYKVVRVVDGDTFSIDKDGVNTTLRLIGLDTPEVVDPRKPVQCFGREASDKAKAILSGQSVRIDLDKTQGEFDKYDRTLAYAFLADGTNFAEMMIREGYGHEYTYNLPYKYQTEFKMAEKFARENERGLWAPGVCEEEIQPAPAPAPTTTPTTTPTPSSGYACLSDTYNCTNFKTHGEAQAVYESCGGVSNDVHRLDADKDGEACESLP